VLVDELDAFFHQLTVMKLQDALYDTQAKAAAAVTLIEATERLRDITVS
jgi:hypothetical protein